MSEIYKTKILDIFEKSKTYKNPIKKQLTCITEDRQSIEIMDTEMGDKLQEDHIFSYIFIGFFTSSFCTLCTGIQETINYIFMGSTSIEISNFNINCLGIGIIYLNLVGYLMLSGILEMFNTVGSKSMKSFQFKHFGIVTIRTRVISLIIFVTVIIPLALLSENILLILKLPEDMSSNTSKFIIKMLPSVLFSINCNINLQYLELIGIYFIPCLIVISALVIQILLNYFLVIILGFDLQGICISSAITSCYSFLITSGFIIFTNPVSKSMFILPPASVFDLQEFLDYLKLCIISGFKYMGQYMGMEVACFMCVYVDEISLSSSLIVLNFANILKHFYTGLALPASGLLHEVKDNTNSYFKNLKIYFWLYISISLILGSITFFFSNFISLMYTDNLQTAKWISKILLLWTVGLIPDIFKSLIDALLIGFGNDDTIMQRNVIVMFFLMIPMCYLLTFNMGYVIYGIWIGFIISTFILTAINTYTLLKLNNSLENINDEKIKIDYSKLGEEEQYMYYKKLEGDKINEHDEADEYDD